MRSSVLLSATLLLAAPSLLAHADTFTLTGGKTTISFSLPASPTPSRSVVGDYFTIDNVSITVNKKTDILDASFFVLTAGGGLCLSNSCSSGVLLDQAGPQLFSGSVSDPTFLAGTYALTNDAATINQYDQNFSLVIAAPAATTVTPEPSSLVLLGTGLVGATGLVRRRFGR